MRLAIVIPGDDFDESRAELQKTIPARVPQKIRREDPVLAIGDFATEMGREPGRRSYFC